MKQSQLLFKLLLSISTSFVGLSPSLAIEGQDRGGGNMLGGRMIESYIKAPLIELKDGQALNQRLEIVRSKSEDFYSLITEGLHMATWYFIPASLKELSQSTTGIPFTSNQAAVQVFDTQEIWVDQTMYESADSTQDEFGGSIEREKLLVHEAIMAGLNSMMNGYLTQGISSMKQLKSDVRVLTNIVFDPNLRNMTTAEMMKRIPRMGSRPDGVIYCVQENIGEVNGVYPTFRSKRCSEASKYNK